MNSEREKLNKRSQVSPETKENEKKSFQKETTKKKGERKKKKFGVRDFFESTTVFRPTFSSSLSS